MKDELPNRAMLLTPPGAAAIAVVRLAGPGVEAFLHRHFSKPAMPNQCVHGKLLDGERVIDDPVVVLHGDSADINLHGGDWVVQECLGLARRSGFRIVESDSELLDASTLIEREMLESLPYARTEEALRALLAQPALWASAFSLQPSAFDPVRVRQILDNRSLWWMLHPPKIAIIGIPNVGKSTLANQLFGTTRSITADIPGTTRDWVGDWANIDGLPIQLLDTPGQRFTDDPIEHAAIQRSQSQINSADLVLLVLDPTQPLDGEQRTLLDHHPNALIILNKADCRPVWNADSLKATHTIATTGDGIDIVRSEVQYRFGPVQSASHPLYWTVRQQRLLERALTDPAAFQSLR